MRAFPDRIAQAFLDDVVDDVVVVVFIGAERPDLCRDAAANEPIHYHVGIFGIDPDAHVFDVFNVAGFVADDQAWTVDDFVPYRVWTEGFDARHIIF